MKTAAVIIARGGSKRLPRKNTRPLCGVPLVAWSVIQARASLLVDDVWVSTDDDEIEQIAAEYGARVIRRPDWSDADQVAANRVYLHALGMIREADEWPDAMVCLLPTSPLRLPGDIDRAIEHWCDVGWHVQTVARNRETVVMKDVKGIIAKTIMWDKFSNYFIGNSGLVNVVSPTWYEWYVSRLTETLGDHDSDLDLQNADHIDAPDPDTYYIECELWQCTEVDTLPEFELAEVLMEHYILKGRSWQEVYK